jgi:hypothetical protein
MERGECVYALTSPFAARWAPITLLYEEVSVLIRPPDDLGGRGREEYCAN